MQEGRKCWVKGYWKENPKMSWKIVTVTYFGSVSFKIEGDSKLYPQPPVGLLELIPKYQRGDIVKIRDTGKIINIKRYNKLPGLYYFDGKLGYEDELELIERNLRCGRPLKKNIQRS